MARFETFEASGSFWFECLSDEDVLLLGSNSFEEASTRDEAIDVVKDLCTSADHYSKGEDQDKKKKGGKFYYHLRNAEGDDFGKSGYFETAEDRDLAIELMQNQGPAAPVEPR